MLFPVFKGNHNLLRCTLFGKKLKDKPGKPYLNLLRSFQCLKGSTRAEAEASTATDTLRREEDIIHKYRSLDQEVPGSCEDKPTLSKADHGEAQ